MLKMNAIGLFVNDMARTIAFYCDVMGMTTDWDGVQPNADLHSGEMRMLLFGRSDFEAMTNRTYTYPAALNGTIELSFDLPTFADVDTEYARVTAAGATPVYPPTTQPWGQRTCYIADPDGNLIEISSFGNL